VEDTTRTTPEKSRALFLTLLEETGNVTYAAAGASLDRSTVYRWRREDPEFRQAWTDANELGAYGMEDIARKRAAESSDVLLIFMLKGAFPEKYRENIHATGDVSLKVIDLADTDEVDDADDA